MERGPLPVENEEKLPQSYEEPVEKPVNTPQNSDGPGGENDTAPEEASSETNASGPRLFSVVELDAREENAPQPVESELEEYDNEIEERLFSLNELELKKKIALNTARAREPTLEKLSALLQLPVEVLERTREASPGEISTPKYCLEWYRRTLAASNNPKRANRDFRKDASSPEVVVANEPRRTGEVELAKRVASVQPAKSSKVALVNEAEIANNICVGRPRHEGTPGLPLWLRSLVHPVTYALVMEEEARSEVRCPQCHCPETYPPTSSST